VKQRRLAGDDEDEMRDFSFLVGFFVLLPVILGTRNGPRSVELMLILRLLNESAVLVSPPAVWGTFEV
jgi:hypothetical protein